MQKVLFGIQLRQAEQYIEDALNEKYPGQYSFVGSAVHKGALAEKLASTTPDIVIIREGLPGPEDLFSLVCKLKRMYPSTRFVFIAGDRVPGDRYLQKLAGYGIYDISYGQKPNINKIIQMVVNPSSFEYGSQFLMSAEELPEGFDNEQDLPVNVEDDKVVAIIREVEKQPDNRKAGNTGNIVLANGKNGEDYSTELGNLHDENEALRRQLNDIQKSLNNKNNLPRVEGTNTLAPKPPKQTGLREMLRNPNAYEPKYSGKDKIITFFGAKNGIGTTTVAYNVALELAYRRKNVLYIELNDVNPMIAYWYDVYSSLALNNGIDKAILGFETGINKDIDESLITREELITNSNPTLAENFKKFPKTLDYLFFSAEYIEAKNKPIISSNSFSQVLLYFMQQVNYNYLILDVNTRIDQSLIETALTFSNKNYIVISQEFSSIGYYQRFFEILRRKGMDFSKKEDGKKDLSDKNAFVLNRYVPKARFNMKAIKDWLDNPNEIFIVADNSKDISDLSFDCVPIIKNTSSKDFVLNISSIANSIES